MQGIEQILYVRNILIFNLEIGTPNLRENHKIGVHGQCLNE